MKDAMPSYVVRPEPKLQLRREASFETLSSARYFARTWAYKSGMPILVVEGSSGRPVERYSAAKTAAPARSFGGGFPEGDRVVSLGITPSLLESPQKAIP